MKKGKQFILKTYSWYISNISKLLFVVGLHFVITQIVSLPYINLLTAFFSFLPFLIDWIVIYILFRPKKTLILKAGFFLIGISFFFVVVRVESVVEIFGQVGYFLVGTYIILSLGEIRRKNL